MNMLLHVPLVGFPSVVRRKSLAILNEDNIFETDDEWAVRWLPDLRITKRNVSTIMPTLSLYVTHERWLAILGLLASKSIISKKQVLSMYRLQTEVLRRQQPMLFLQDLCRLIHEGVRMFSDEEIIALASTQVTISESDINFLMNTATFRNHLPISLLKEWAGGAVERLSVLHRARIARRLVSQNGEALDFEMLCQSFNEAVEEAPYSDAVKIFFTLMYGHKDIRTRQGRDRAREALCKGIYRMIVPFQRGLINFERGEELLGWYLTNPLIDQKDKDKMEEDIKPHTDAIAKQYRDFIKGAKETSSTKIEE